MSKHTITSEILRILAQKKIAIRRAAEQQKHSEALLKRQHTENAN